MSELRDLNKEEQLLLILKLKAGVLTAIGKTIEVGYLDAAIPVHVMQQALQEALLHTFALLPTDQAKLAHLKTFTDILTEDVTAMVRGGAVHGRLQ